MTKPFKGRITNWSKDYVCEGQGLGFVIRGDFLEHPDFGKVTTHTSWVESINEGTGELETRNSRYALVGVCRNPLHAFRETFELIQRNGGPTDIGRFHVAHIIAMDRDLHLMYVHEYEKAWTWVGWLQGMAENAAMATPTELSIINRRHRGTGV